MLNSCRVNRLFLIFLAEARNFIGQKLCRLKNRLRRGGILRLGGCPRIENLLRKIYFGTFSRINSLNKAHYSPYLFEKVGFK